ncbi:MAG: hypothetical protein HZY79_02165 [Rhodoblastus sp.]|nr:MAG: hypothetical protein HZY79_02165 [Rhodoblastus sp.]
MSEVFTRSPGVSSITAARDAVRRADLERQRADAERVPASIIGPIADSLALSPEAVARNAKAFAATDQRAEIIAEYANILGSYARLGVSRHTKATFNTLAWLMRDLRPAINAIEEAP